MIKISFSGYAGSGKTSLMNEVKKILSLKSRVETIEQLNGKNPFDCDKKSCFASQFFYMTNQINQENIKAGESVDYLLCDQSLLDQWIFWKNYISCKEMNPKLQEKHDLMRNIYQFWIRSYDLIFNIRIDYNELKKRKFANEFRSPDLDYIKRIDELFKPTIEEDDLSHVVEIWNNYTIDESAHEIVRIISEYKVNENDSLSDSLL